MLFNSRPAAITFILIPLFALFAQNDTAEIDPYAWKWNLNTNLTLSMNTYSENWTGGERSAGTWVWLLTTSAEKQLSPKLLWKNALKLGFGETIIEQEDSSGNKFWLSPEKSSDQIDFESLMRLTLKKPVSGIALTKHLLSQGAQ